ncbi:hypothetical protein OSB04_032253 [Centaurea solstitialis]|uniref:DDE Tnp4 domain-containing protein n=1 Tax=Centaurea solstitialis TaxID=347529 RepID=A0AA38SB60_9ASTR|nr:hypothetical protein OSB04_032253 [Centaurea solstitialis]
MDRNHLVALVAVWNTYIQILVHLLCLIMWLIELEDTNSERETLGQRTFTRLQVRSTEIQRITRESDVNCINELRMDRNAFAMLCDLLKTRGGLLDDGNITIEEQVAIFINILAHHTKNRTIQGCLGAIDGTYIEVTVPEFDKPRYRTRKGHIATNVLGVCTRDLKFVYDLAGWEGSATDSRVLRDAVTRQNGLKITPGNYYLADAGYINGEGFLAPYRGTRYHLREWEDASRAPTTKEEYFNMKHSHARNIIERIVKMADRRVWTPDEEDLLITILQDIVINGGRGDNGSFRSEAPEILEEYLKKHPNKNYTANKPFPAYEQLKLVFGKDRATGNMAESAADALESMNAENDDDFEIPPNVPPAPSPSNATSHAFVQNEGEATSKKRKGQPSYPKCLKQPLIKLMKQQIK